MSSFKNDDLFVVGFCQVSRKRQESKKSDFHGSVTNRLCLQFNRDLILVSAEIPAEAGHGAVSRSQNSDSLSDAFICSLLTSPSPFLFLPRFVPCKLVLVYFQTPSLLLGGGPEFSSSPPSIDIVPQRRNLPVAFTDKSIRFSINFSPPSLLSLVTLVFENATIHSRRGVISTSKIDRYYR